MKCFVFTMNKRSFFFQMSKYVINLLGNERNYQNKRELIMYKKANFHTFETVKYIQTWHDKTNFRTPLHVTKCLVFHISLKALP